MTLVVQSCTELLRAERTFEGTIRGVQQHVSAEGSICSECSIAHNAGEVLLPQMRLHVALQNSR